MRRALLLTAALVLLIGALAFAYQAIWRDRTYRALLLASLQSALQYRVQMFLYAMFSFMRPIIFLAAWSAVATSPWPCAITDNTASSGSASANAVAMAMVAR